MPPIVGPTLSQEIEKESLLIRLSHSPSACGTAPKQPIFSCCPFFFRREAWEASAGKAAALSHARGWTCADWGPGRSTRETGLRRVALGSCGISFHFIFPARPPFGQAFPCAPTVRAQCAHCAQGALRGSRPSGCGSSLPSLPPRGGSSGQNWFCAWK